MHDIDDYWTYVWKEQIIERLSHLPMVTEDQNNRHLNLGSLTPESKILTTMQPLRSLEQPGNSDLFPWISSSPKESHEPPGPAAYVWNHTLSSRRHTLVTSHSEISLLQAWVRERIFFLFPLFSCELLLLVITLVVRATRVWIYCKERKAAELVAEKWQTPEHLQPLFSSLKPGSPSPPGFRTCLLQSLFQDSQRPVSIENAASLPDWLSISQTLLTNN